LFLLIPCTLRYPSHCLFVLEASEVLSTRSAFYFLGSRRFHQNLWYTHCGQNWQSDRLPENSRSDCCGTVDPIAAQNRLQVHTHPKLHFGHFDTRYECPLAVGLSVPWQSVQGLCGSWFECSISFH
jgi:hypothetical protein